MRKRISHQAGRIAALALLCLLLFSASSICAYAKDSSGDMVVCDNDEYTAYPDVVSQLLPAHTMKQTVNDVFTYLEEGAVAEASDVQALPALEIGIAAYWYPHYLATVVIAVDRDRTDAEIRGWRDLLAAGEVVGFDDTHVNRYMLMAAMAYGLEMASGLEGENFTLGEAAKLLAALRTQELLARKSFHPAIIICYDYQAAALRQCDRNIEIIVPEEGTLTYVKGLLSKQPLDFEGDADALLLSAGLRLPDGQRDPAFYPGETDYERAALVTDYEHFNAVCQDATRVMRRTVLHTRLYTSADSREHQLFVLVYTVFMVVWIAMVIRRAMQKGVRRTVLLTGILLLGWIAVRLLKFQLIFATGLTRLLWYSYYLFLLALPLALLWLAWVIDRPDDKAAPPKWLAVPAAVNGALVALVFTNDLHNWIFKLDLSNPNWDSDYSYGAGYYVIMAVCAAMALAAVVMMLLKSRRNPRKKRFLYPLVFCALLTAYSLGYFLRIPPAWESDLTMIAGLFTLLFIEAALRTGMIPVNTKYSTLFKHSPLSMQILDNADNVMLSSAAGPLRRDDNALLFAAPIVGGWALWQEDISALNRLHREVEVYARSLANANAVLAEEEQIKRAMEEENARTQILSQLEAEIAAHTARLSTLIENNESPARIVLLLCYIKRRCNLFFRERETQSLPADELTVYIDELAEFAGYANVKIITTSQISAGMGLRRATLFYDFFYSVVDWAAGCGCPFMLVRLGVKHGVTTLQLLPSEDVRSFRMEDGLARSIAQAGGTVDVRDLDGAVGISLSFHPNESADSPGTPIPEAFL